MPVLSLVAVAPPLVSGPHCGLDPLNLLKQGRHRHLQRLREGVNHAHGWVDLATLDVADVLMGYTGPLSKGSLSETSLPAKQSHCVAECGDREIASDAKTVAFRALSESTACRDCRTNSHRTRVCAQSALHGRSRMSRSALIEPGTASRQHLSEWVPGVGPQARYEPPSANVL